MERTPSNEEAYNKSKYFFFIAKGNYTFYFNIYFYPIIIYNRPKKKRYNINVILLSN